MRVPASAFGWASLNLGDKVQERFGNASLLFSSVPQSLRSHLCYCHLKFMHLCTSMLNSLEPACSHAMPWATALIHCSKRFCPMHGCTATPALASVPIQQGNSLTCLCTDLIGRCMNRNMYSELSESYVPFVTVSMPCTEESKKQQRNIIQGHALPSCDEMVATPSFFKARRPART